MAINPPGSALGSVPGGQAPVPPATTEDEFTATAAQTVFTLTQPFTTGGLIVLTINGQRFALDTDFTAAGTTLTWLDTPFVLESGDSVVVIYNND